LASLDLTAAFDVVDRKLLKFFWKSLGYQVNLSIFWMTGLATNLFSVKWTKTFQNFWILIFVKFRSQFWAICCLPCLFPLEDITTPTMSLGENYLFSSGKTEK
jgi:hypothetical protein